MPIKKHILQAHKINGGCVVEVPQTICDAIGIQDGTPIKVFSNSSGYSFTVEIVPSYENAVQLERVNAKNTELQKENKDLKSSVETLKHRVAELENNL